MNKKNNTMIKQKIGKLDSNFRIKQLREEKNRDIRIIRCRRDSRLNFLLDPTSEVDEISSQSYEEKLRAS